MQIQSGRKCKDYWHISPTHSQHTAGRRWQTADSRGEIVPSSSESSWDGSALAPGTVVAEPIETTTHQPTAGTRSSPCSYVDYLCDKMGLKRSESREHNDMFVPKIVGANHSDRNYMDCSGVNMEARWSLRCHSDVFSVLYNIR